MLVETFRPRARGPHPALVWFHGGGYVIGAASMDGLRMQSWAERFECFVASVDYRLAPEHPFPAAHDDAMAALEWVLRSASDLDVDPDRVVVGGASAGAGLAAGVALAARDRGLALAGQLLFYPMLDDRQQTPSSRWAAAVWSPTANEFGWRSYLGDAYGGDVSDYAAPSRTTSYDGLPPTIVLVGGADGFFDEDVAYAAELTRAGVPTDVRVYAGAPHGFDLVAPESSVAALAAADAERWLNRSWPRRLERHQPSQSTATSSATQISRIRSSESRPNRSTNTAIDTLSMESRFTAHRAGTGSSPGSRTTSLANRRIGGGAGRDQRPAQPRDGRVARQDHDRATPDLGRLAPPHLTASRCAHERAAASRNEARSPQSSGASRGWSSYAE